MSTLCTVMPTAGLDFLTFLAATVLVIPIFKSVKASPVLGFLFSGLILEKLGLFRNIEQVQKLSELGVLFLLFEMGLELSLDRLKGLAKYAFGLGTAQVALTTLAFTLFALPVGNGLGTQILVKVFHANPQLAAIRTLDEAIVIGAALSLSSSAFVLQLLSERGELTTKFGSATLGILLLQDIAVVPFLVLLPVIETTDLEGQSTATLLTLFVPTALQTLGSLALLLLGGRLILRRVFELVAESRSDETFVALCLLTVTGASLLTQRLGFSDTLGAFIAGVLLAETNYRTQVEADIRPFRGMLLGLFFVTTGSSLDLQLFFQQWPIVIALTGGLIATKIGIIGTTAQAFGLSKAEAIRTGFMLSQGGEFAFVLLSLANELKILPMELNRLLIIVVVLSMALTPALAEAGKRFAEAAEGDEASGDLTLSGGEPKDQKDVRPVVICGFGEIGQTVANMLESPFAISLERGKVPYVAFDMSPHRLEAARAAGFNVMYGDATRPQVLRAAGIEYPRAIAVVFSARQGSVNAVKHLHEAFPDVHIFARAIDLNHASELRQAGATTVTTSEQEAGLGLGASLLGDLGANENSLNFLTKALRKQITNHVGEMATEAQSRSPDEQNAPAEQVFVFDSEACNPDEMRRSFLPPSRTAALSRTNASISSGDSRSGESTSQSTDEEDSEAMRKPGTQLLAEAKVNESHQDPKAVKSVSQHSHSSH
ncbi:hypothetical protein WJX74_002016 [Apatococcus lobatus]|uniref:RCK N-terminal domain-containing protein n=1 Tax=Apatococcus lobatus TaxID=904363 RepID=A0AAW1S6J5_9CHLO